ncbi:MAG: hypothetical protein ACE5JU_22525 [Candidatus Binatia bacterium]
MSKQRVGNRWWSPLRNMIARAQGHRSKGKSVRWIAAKLGVSKSWVAENTRKEGE